MFQSKPIKEFKPSSKLYLWWLDTTVSEYYYAFTWKFFGKPWQDIKKMYGWYVNVFNNDFDFDGCSLFQIMEYKLQRLEKCLLKGMAHQSTKDMKALKLAIKLAGRLKDDKYDEVAYDRHVKKWGESKRWFEPCELNKDLSVWKSSRSNVKTPEDEKQCSDDLRAFYEASYARCKKEERYFYNILHTFLRNLWD